MSEIVNLRRVRKHKARADAAQAADQARRLHGRTRAERARDEQDRARREALLDGARLDDTALQDTLCADGPGDKAS